MTKRIDLRATPTWERPALVAAAFEALSLEESFVFIVDTDPLPLIVRLDQDYPARAAWTQRHVGHREWEIVVTRVDITGDREHGINHLRRTIFARCKPETQDALAAAARERTALKGEYIYNENEAWPYLGLLCEGALSAGSGANAARDRTFFEVHPFMAFGIAAALDGGLTFTNMRVITKSAKYLIIPIDTIHACADNDPQVLAAIGFLSAQQSRTLARALNAQVSMPTIGRVAAALLPYASPERGMHPALPPVTMLTQTQLAAAAGTVKEVAARAIAELESKEALRRERGRVRYLDRNKLLEYTQ